MIPIKTLIEKTGLSGPHPFNKASLEYAVSNDSGGVFLLGQKAGDSFYAYFVGRSGHDVAGEISKYLSKSDRYFHFFYRYFDRARESYEMECQIFHGLPVEDNLGAHPRRDPAMQWKCPDPNCSL
jgi:hypothetical protein